MLVCLFLLIFQQGEIGGANNLFIKMGWKRLNEQVEFWETPVLGTEAQKEGKAFMALCLDPASKKPYRGIARQIVERRGSPDTGFSDKSKLIVVESYDLLNWEIVGDLNLEGLEEIILKLLNNQQDEKEFIGPEDPDILVDERGKRHIYFTIPFRYKARGECDIYLGHAEGNSLECLTATAPVLGKVNEEIIGFKEICPALISGEERLILAETYINAGNREYSAISVCKAEDWSEKWSYGKLVHDPAKETKKWCAGHSSPCRFFPSTVLQHRDYLVGIMNGRELAVQINGKIDYGRFRPGLFLFDKDSEDIIWVDDEPLLEDPVATSITFASELICLDQKEAILYAHPDDSFVRAYRLDLEKIKNRLPLSL